MKRDRQSRWIYPILGLLLLGFTLYALTQNLERYDPADIIRSLSLISDRQLLLALIFTGLNYLAISCYDAIAFRQLNYNLKQQRILFTTFITYAVSNTTGFNLLIGGGIRYRFYSLWNVPTKTIAKVIALGNITFWLGTLSISGITLAFNPLPLPPPLNIEASTIRFLGIASSVVAGSYIYFCWQKKRLRIKGKTIRFPRLTTSLKQIGVFAIDWALAAAVLYFLIPNYAGKSYLQFFTIYLLGMVASIVSNIPGGIGVFETVIIFLLPREVFTPNVLGSLLIYRIIRFVIPLAIALILVIGFEIKRRWR